MTRRNTAIMVSRLAECRGVASSHVARNRTGVRISRVNEGAKPLGAAALRIVLTSDDVITSTTLSAHLSGASAKHGRG